jgi:hypothetical protein
VCCSHRVMSGESNGKRVVRFADEPEVAAEEAMGATELAAREQASARQAKRRRLRRELLNDDELERERENEFDEIGDALDGDADEEDEELDQDEDAWLIDYEERKKNAARPAETEDVEEDDSRPKRMHVVVKEAKFEQLLEDHTPIGLRRALMSRMMEGETVIAALRRLGGTKDDQAIQEVTEAADELLSMGHLGVYQDTFEVLLKYLRTRVYGENAEK